MLPEADWNRLMQTLFSISNSPVIAHDRVLANSHEAEDTCWEHTHNPGENRHDRAAARAVSESVSLGAGWPSCPTTITSCHNGSLIREKRMDGGAEREVKRRHAIRAIPSSSWYGGVVVEDEWRGTKTRIILLFLKAWPVDGWMEGGGNKRDDRWR